MKDQANLHFYASSPESCGYLPDRDAVSAFANPYVQMDMGTYNQLIQFGFRRSGGYVYRPHCPNCTECISLRIQADGFNPSRNDRRTLNRNGDLFVDVKQGRYTPEYFDLYQRYINQRHAGGSMENPSPGDYRRFLLCAWARTRFIEFRLGRDLVAVAVTDLTDTGYSAVYTFFEPELAQRSLGHLAILQQIELARERQLPFVYLGYWIQDCAKMQYKMRYRPAQAFYQEQWVDLDTLLAQKPPANPSQHEVAFS